LFGGGNVKRADVDTAAGALSRREGQKLGQRKGAVARTERKGVEVKKRESW